VACFGRRDWVKTLMNYRVVGWGRYKLRSVWGLIIAIRIRVRSTVIPGGIGGRSRVWISKARCGVHIALPIHDGRSLLWHPKIRS
jgi:hypothetical protein